jgi:hypothetical protein
MGIHLFVIRSWYFLAIAFIGTLHVSIPLAIATYYATRDREPMTMVMFVPIFFIALAYLNINAMRAVMRSYGKVGEPDFVNTVKALIRHITLDTILPFNIALVLAAGIAYALRFTAGRDALLAFVFDPTGSPETLELIGLIQETSGIEAALLFNAFTVLPYIYAVILCLFGVSIASGAASASANPPGHLPVHGFAKKFWHIVATFVVNTVLVVALAGAAGLGAAWSQLNGVQILPAIGFGVMGVVLVLGYFNAYVVFALAYCAYEDDRGEEQELLRHLMRYGIRDETLDLKALRTSRMKGGPVAAG